jgi:replicative DNA helicase
MRLATHLAPQCEVLSIGGPDYRLTQSDRGRRKGHQGMAANPLTESVRSLGLWGLRSHEKFIPRLYFSGSHEQRLDLLRGLLDTDGWVERWGSVRFVTSSPQLASDIVELVRSIGGWCSQQRKQPHFSHLGERRNGRPCYVSTIHHPKPRSLFLLSTKQSRAPAQPRRRRFPTFTSIEPSRTAPTQCIAVSHPSRLYVTDDHVVTHNTALAINMGENVALSTGMPVAIFSMEMGATQLALRMIGSVGRLDQHKLRTGRLAADDWDKLSAALGRLNEAPIVIDETPALNALEVRSRARRLLKQYGKLGLVIVDYIQLMQSSSQGENRATEISEISRSLKSLA